MTVSEIIPGRVKQKLLNFGIVQRTGALLRRYRVIFHCDLICAWLLLNGTDPANGRQRRRLIRPGDLHPGWPVHHFVSCTDAAYKTHNEEGRSQGRRKADLIEP